MGGTADAYGHRKLGGIGAQTGEALKEITGEGIIYQQIGYLMRSGQPDALDLMVATNYAVMAADLLLEGTHGRLVALRNGIYVNVPIEVVRAGREAGRRRGALRRRRVPAEDPPRRRQADVPVLRPAEYELAARLGGHELLPGRSAFRHRHEAVRGDAPRDGRGRGRRRLVRRRPDREPPAGAVRGGGRQGGRRVRPHRHDGEPDRAAAALLRARPPRGGRGRAARDERRGDDGRGARRHRLPDRRRRPSRLDRRRAGRAAPRAGRVLRRRGDRPPVAWRTRSAAWAGA